MTQNNAEKPGFDFVTPILCVESVASSLLYYRDLLGFDINWTWSEDGFEKGEPTFACVCRGNVSYFLAEQNQGNPGAWSSLFLSSLEALAAIYEEYLASGAKIVQPPEDMPWGMREMWVEDLDGNTFRIGSSIEQQS